MLITMDKNVRMESNSQADRLINTSMLANLFILLVVAALTTSQAAWADRTTSNTYYANGLLQSMDGSRTDVSDTTSYEYTAEGYLSKITNALGHATEMSDHDGRGNPRRVVDANGVETVLTYHPRGYIESSTVLAAAGSLLTSLVYDDVGQVTSIALPNGSQLNYEYDGAQRLVAISNNLGERIEYTLDAAGNRTKEDIRAGDGSLAYTHQMAFDELSRLMNDVGANGQNTHIDYDLNDNPTTETDANTNQTQRAFDPLNRLATMTDAKLNDVSYAYDTQDRIRTVTDQNGNVTTYNYNAFGDLTSLVSEATGTTRFEYDSAGNVTKRTDARGLVTDYTYDALNRLSTVKYPGNAQEGVTYQYDDTTAGNKGIGRLTSIINSDASMTFVYDDRGNTVEVIQAVSGEFYSTLYAYDNADNVEQMTYPSGRVVDYTLDAIGQVTAITTKASASAAAETVVSNTTYVPYGPVTAMTYGNGLSTNGTYDRDYRLNGLVSGSVYDTVFAYDAANNITEITDGVDPLKTQSFSYDELYYLSEDTGQYGTIGYTYDPAGNRTQKASTQSGTLTDGEQVFQYNQANRMAAFEKNGSTVATYKYNALGQRVEKTRNDEGSSTVYFYDLTGQVIGELITDSSDIQTQRDIIWLNSQPVAQYASEDGGAAVVGYIHSDQLNTPRVATDSAQQIVWRWDSDAFGVGEANNDQDNDGTNTLISLRFPGQVHDAESGLHYNYFRDYDPSLGQYVQSDPIGLQGGLNTYAYVGGNPLMYTDPLGLIKKDKWYGYNDKNFRDWVHKQKQDMGLPGNKNFTKDQLKDLYDDWNDQGCPGGKGAKSGGGKGNKLRKSVNRRNPFAPSPDKLPPGHPLEDLL